MKIPVVANLRRTLRHAEFIAVCAFRLIPLGERRDIHQRGFRNESQLARPAIRSREFLFASGELLGSQGR